MALSDRERRLLAEMEEALATDDPRLESRLAATTMTASRPRILLGVSLTLGGIAILFGGLVAKATPIGVAVLHRVATAWDTSQDHGSISLR